MLGLYQSTSGFARDLIRLPESCTSAASLKDDCVEDGHAREAQYCAALTNLASACDALHSATMSLRTARKMRRGLELECVAQVTRAHTDEVLAIGRALASNGAVAISGATAQLRQCIQLQKDQAAQLRSFAEALKDTRRPGLPFGSSLYVGVARPGVGPGHAAWPAGAQPLEQVLSTAYEQGREVKADTVSEALRTLFADGDGGGGRLGGTAGTCGACGDSLPADGMAARPYRRRDRGADDAASPLALAGHAHAHAHAHAHSHAHAHQQQ